MDINFRAGLFCPIFDLDSNSTSHKNRSGLLTKMHKNEAVDFSKKKKNVPSSTGGFLNSKDLKSMAGRSAPARITQDSQPPMALCRCDFPNLENIVYEYYYSRNLIENYELK